MVCFCSFQNYLPLWINRLFTWQNRGSSFSFFPHKLLTYLLSLGCCVVVWLQFWAARVSCLIATVQCTQRKFPLLFWKGEAWAVWDMCWHIVPGRASEFLCSSLYFDWPKYQHFTLSVASDYLKNSTCLFRLNCEHCWPCTWQRVFIANKGMLFWTCCFYPLSV